jgi:CheY-like chemotaxis protein
MNIDSMPQGLLESIRSGQCVAFVGAGLLQPSLPGWEGLLWRLAGHLDGGDPKRAAAEAWLQHRPLQRRDFEGLGEMLRDALGTNFFPALQQALSKELRDETRERLRLLRGIPFHYVLTTNFDHHLGKAALPTSDAFAGLATAGTRGWAHPDFWDRPAVECLWQGRLMALHGSLEREEGLVFNSRSYRELLHGKPAFRAMLRTLFATRNILFIGFSFADAYVDDLRSEILSMIGLGGTARELRDYAILPDLNSPLRAHLSANENLEVLHFSTEVNGTPNQDFSGFDSWLRSIHAHTNPAASLAGQLSKARILWCDAALTNNERAFQALQGGPTIEQVTTPEGALAAVEAAEQRKEPFDVIVTHWGHATQAGATLLRCLPSPRPPVVVFASGFARASNRLEALRRGAAAYADTWSELFEVLHDLLTDGGRSGRVVPPT